MQHPEARALLTYKIDGTDATKYVSDLYLHQRVQKILQPDPPADTPADPLPSELPSEPTEAAPRRRARYFDVPEDNS
jgi:hypothetical protein